MWKYVLAVATALVAGGGKVARIARRLVPPFLRPTSRSPEPGILDLWSRVSRLGERFKSSVMSMRPLQQQIAGISAKYGPRIEAAWRASDSTQSAVRKALRIARGEAGAINRRLDRLDPLVSKFEQDSRRIARTLERFEQDLSRKAGDHASLLIVRRGIADIVATVQPVRTVDVRFQSLMSDIHGPLSELNTSSERGATLAARTVAAHDRILQACEHLLVTVDRLLGR